MSHYAVMVVVDKAETAQEATEIAELRLFPYSEHNEVEPYFSPESPEFVKMAIENYAEQSKTSKPVPGTPQYREWVKAAVSEFCGEDAVYNEETDQYGVMSTYNPDSKWDWFVLGGRWQGAFLAREHAKVLMGSQEAASSQPMLGEPPAMGSSAYESLKGRADAARKQDIDFDQMKTLAIFEAERAYDHFEEVTAGLMVPPSFDELLERNAAGVPEGDPAFRQVVERTRNQFFSYQWTKAVREISPIFSSLHEHWEVGQGGRDAFIQRARQNAYVSPYAILDAHNGWSAPGKMGWFGVSSDTQEDRKQWKNEMEEYIDSLADDAWLLIYDLHI